MHYLSIRKIKVFYILKLIQILFGDRVRVIVACRWGVVTESVWLGGEGYIERSE